MSNTPPTLEIEKHFGNLSANERDGHFNVSINNAWAGDSEIGFGAETQISFGRHEAKELADWLYGRLGISA